MKLSEGVEWAVHCGLLLSTIPPDAALPARAMAEFHGVSVSYLLKHLQAMAAAGILEASPGPKGGYRLMREPARITVLEIVMAIEGQQPAFRCTEIRQRGPCAASPRNCKRPCAINRVMLRAEAAWRDELRSVTLGDILQEVAEGLDEKSIRKGTDWLNLRIRIQNEGNR